MKNKKKRTASRSLECSCGQQFTAIFTSGVVRRTVICPRTGCAEIVNTNGKQIAPSERRTCGGCGREKWYRKATECCFFCGWIARL